MTKKRLQTYMQIWPLPLTNWVTLSMLLVLPRPYLIPCKIKIMIFTW